MLCLKIVTKSVPRHAPTLGRGAPIASLQACPVTLPEVVAMTVPTISVALGLFIAVAGNAGANDDDRDFDKRYQEQLKRYEKDRKEAWKRYQEQERERHKKQEEWFKKRDEKYREDRERQVEAQRDWDEPRRNAYRQQLRGYVRDGEGYSRWSAGWWLPPTQPVYRPGVAFRYAPQVVTQIGPVLTTTLQQAWQNPQPYGPNFQRYATDLVQRGQRLTELAQQGRDAAALQSEFAAFDANWQQVMEPLQQAAMHNEAARVLAWQVYQSGRQLRLAIGFDRSANPDWQTASVMANELNNTMAQVDATLQRDYAGTPGAEELLYEVRNSWREAGAVGNLIQQQAQLTQIREQHGYFVIAFERVVQRLRDWQVEESYRGLMQQVGRIDRRLCDALGIAEAVTGDISRVLVDHAWQLSATTDRLRRLVREGLGEGDKQVTDYYIQPADHLAYQSELLAQALAEGRDPYVVRGGWAMIEQLAPQVIQRVHVLDAARFGQAHQLANECAAIMGQMRPVFGQ